MKRSAGKRDARSGGVSRRRFLLSTTAVGVSAALLGTTATGGTVAEAEWRFETGGSIRSSPTVVDDRVFVGSYDGTVYALDAETGDETWAFDTRGEVHSSPTVVDGRVFVGSYDGTVYALDAETGDGLWEFNTGDSVYSSPTVTDGRVFVGSDDHSVYAIDSATGDEEWAFETGDAVRSSPTVADGWVFVGSDDGNLYTLDAETGRRERYLPTDGVVSSSPTVADDAAYVGSDDGNLYAVAVDGAVEWSFETSRGQGIRWSSPTVASGTVYVGGTDAYVYAIDDWSGDEEWRFGTGASVRSSPTVASDTVFVGSDDGNLYALDAETGDERWRFETGGAVDSSPTVAGRKVFFGSDDGTVYALSVDPWSSYDSRVELGTLGHHDDWANQTLPDPPTFEIRDLDHPAEVEQGETVSVGVTVANVGDRDGDADVTLAVAGALVEESVDIAAGEEETVTADVAIDATPGDHDLTASVAWAARTVEETSQLVVRAPQGAAAFELSDLDAPDEADSGGVLDVDVTVTNVGDGTGEADLTFELADASESITVDLAGGDSETVSVVLSLEDVTDGEYDLLVRAAWNGDSDDIRHGIAVGDPGDGLLANQELLMLGGGGVLTVLGAYVLHRSRTGSETPGEDEPSPAAEDATAEETQTRDEVTADTLTGSSTDASIETSTDVDTPDGSAADETGSAGPLTGTRQGLDPMAKTTGASAESGADSDDVETVATDSNSEDMETVIEGDDAEDMETVIGATGADDVETTIEGREVDDMKTTIGGAGGPRRDRRPVEEREDRLEEIEGLIEDAENAQDDHRFDDAVEKCEAAMEATSDLLTAVEGEDSELTARVEACREQARQLQKDVQAQKGAHRVIVRKLERASQTLDGVESMLEEGTVDEASTAIEELDDVEGMIADVEELHRRHGAPDAPQNTGRLSRRCSTLREQVEDALSGDVVSSAGPPSGEIPSPSAVSLTYEGLTKRELLGSGGNADVYRATAETADGTLTVALKEPRLAPVIHTDTMESPPEEPAKPLDRDDDDTETKPARSREPMYDSETRHAGHLERLLKEAETWQRLDDHDHIVGVIDYGDEPIPWIAMEYMDGGHLGDRAGEMPLDQALWTAIAITKAVRHAHRRGVAHLDLKSENILFREMDDAWDVPKVADWGLSKHLLQYSKSIEGLSPHYAAPEQFDDSLGPGDDLTDIYQLGTVFYELFTGRPPFQGNPAQVMHKVMHEQVTPPSELADVPEELDDILLKAMAKQKHHRYEAVLVLRNDLQDLRSSYSQP